MLLYSAIPSYDQKLFSFLWIHATIGTLQYVHSNDFYFGIIVITVPNCKNRFGEHTVASMQQAQTKIFWLYIYLLYTSYKCNIISTITITGLLNREILTLTSNFCMIFDTTPYNFVLYRCPFSVLRSPFSVLRSPPSRYRLLHV